MTRIEQIEQRIEKPNYTGFLAKEDIRYLLSKLREQAWVRVSERDWWFNKARPIINAIGEISVQEAMDAIERMLDK